MQIHWILSLSLPKKTFDESFSLCLSAPPSFYCSETLGNVSKIWNLDPCPVGQKSSVKPPKTVAKCSVDWTTECFGQMWPDLAKFRNFANILKASVHFSWVNLEFGTCLIQLGHSCKKPKYWTNNLVPLIWNYFNVRQQHLVQIITIISCLTISREHSFTS